MLSGAEEKGNAPDARKGNQGVDYSADYRVLTAADPSDDVEAEKSYATPVQRTDYSKHKCDPVHYH